MFDTNHFLHFINKILYPIVMLKSIEDVDTFFNTDQEWPENTPFYRTYRKVGYNMTSIRKQTRVIAFADKVEYKEELEKLEEAALALVLREDLRVARMTN